MQAAGQALYLVGPFQLHAGIQASLLRTDQGTVQVDGAVAVGDAEFSNGQVTVAGSYSAQNTSLYDRATVTFQGPVDGLGAVSDIQGSVIDLSRATLTPGASTLPGLYMSDSTLRDSHNLTVTGLFNSYGGVLDAAGGQGSLTALGGPNPGGLN